MVSRTVFLGSKPCIAQQQEPSKLILLCCLCTCIRINNARVSNRQGRHVCRCSKLEGCFNAIRNYKDEHRGVGTKQPQLIERRARAFIGPSPVKEDQCLWY
eukprot:2248834-Amphidinium_carterae.2